MQMIINELNKLSFIVAPVFYKLLFISITGAFVGGVILIIRKCFDKKIPPLWKYLMWAVVVLGLIIPFRPQSEIAVTQNISRIEDTSFREEYDEARLKLKIDSQMPNIADEENTAADDWQHQVNMLFWKSLICDVAIPLIWFFGMVFSLLFFIGNKIYLTHKINFHKIENNQFNDVLLQCKNKLGIKNNIEIVYQDYMKSPALFGLLKPKILLPLYAKDLSEENLYYVFLHELSHYKRKDMIVNYILLFVQAVHWFNPLVWLLFKFIREDMELLNDSYVLKVIGDGQSRSYAKSLVEVLGLSHNVSLMPKLLCMIDGKKNVERRISMMKLGETFKKHKIIVAVCCLAVICVVGGLFLTRKNAELPQNRNEILFENRTEYVGDNSKVGNILSALSYPEKVTYKNFSLNTTEPPYAITVNLKTDTETRDFYSGEAAQGVFKKIAFTLFSLIGNVEQVNFSLDDGANPYGFTVYRGQADSILGEDYFNRTKTLEGLQELLADIEEKVPVNYGEIQDNSSDIGLTALTFPAYEEENPNKLPIIDMVNNTEKFNVVGNFPKTWEYRTASNGEKNIPMGELYAPVYIYENNKLIGYVGFNTFEPYEGEIAPEDYYKSVYSSLRLSRYFRWDPYTAVTGDEISETGIVEIYYLDETEIDKHPGALASVPELESNGILSYNKSGKVYIGIAFMPDVIEREQLESIAKSVKILKIE